MQNNNFDPSIDSAELKEYQGVPDQKFNWTHEEIAHVEKPPLWYIGIAVLALASIGLIILLNDSIDLSDILSIIVILVMAVALIVVGNRRHPTSSYVIDGNRLEIDDQRKVAINNYRAFTIKELDAQIEVELIPIRKLGVPVSIFIPETSAEPILDHINDIIPYVEADELSLFDWIAKKL